MKVVAVYNMKGGVGKTTTAINLSYRAAAGGARTLLWDLDPQAASSFAFRVQPRIEGFDRKSLETGDTLAAAIKRTDFDGLDLLPASFAYRKFERFLDALGRADDVMSALVKGIGQDHDVVFLDCPAGFSLLIEGVFAAADLVLVPALPTVLSLRTVARVIKWADKRGAAVDLAAFFSMVDRRRALHRTACELAAGLPEIFLDHPIPYASVVEQMAVRRSPLPVFAPREPATRAFDAVGCAVDQRLAAAQRGLSVTSHAWASRVDAIESLIDRLDATRESAPDPSTAAPSDARPSERTVIHRFDTDRRELEKNGYLLELVEEAARFVVVLGAVRASSASGRRVQAQVDRAWAVEILSGTLSPLAALERRVGRSGLVGEAADLVRAQPLHRLTSVIPETPALSIVRRAG